MMTGENQWRAKKRKKTRGHLKSSDGTVVALMCVVYVSVLLFELQTGYKLHTISVAKPYSTKVDLYRNVISQVILKEKKGIVTHSRFKRKHLGRTDQLLC